MRFWQRAAELAVRPISMGIALLAQAYLLQKSTEGFLIFNGIYATQNILAHLFYPGIATSAFRAANGFSKIQRRFFYIASAVLAALALAFLPFWSAATIALAGTVLTAARSIMAQFYLGQARPILSSMLTQIVPWSTLLILLAVFDTRFLVVLPLLMAVPSGLIAFSAILRLVPSQLSHSLRINWKLGAFALIQSFKNHGLSLLASSFPSAEVASALFIVKFFSAAQNVVEYAGARRVKALSLTLRSCEKPAQTRALKTALRDGLILGLALMAGVLLLYFQPFVTGYEVLAALNEYIVVILTLSALLSPFFLTRYVAVNILQDERLFSINVTSVAILLLVYAAGQAFLAPGTTILASYAAASLYFMAALTYDLSKCQKR